MDPIEVIEYKGYDIKVYQDEYPCDPREGDNLGTMLCKHRRHNLGDTKESKEMSHEDIQKYVKRKDVISLPLYLLDHSGLWMRTSRFGCDQGGWDTSMVGWITVTYEKIRKEYGWETITKKRIDRIKAYLDNEVRAYSDYLEGAVVGYVIEKDEERLDSCWGYYPERGHDRYDYSIESEHKDMLTQCRHIIDCAVKKDLELENIVINTTTA